MSEKEFWQLAYLVALHHCPAPAKAATAADQSVDHFKKRFGEQGLSGR